jgi:hypothetical protein
VQNADAHTSIGIDVRMEQAVARERHTRRTQRIVGGEDESCG